MNLLFGFVKQKNKIAIENQEKLKQLPPETPEEIIIEEKKKITNLVDEYNRLYMFICYYYHNNMKIECLFLNFKKEIKLSLCLKVKFLGRIYL